MSHLTRRCQDYLNTASLSPPQQIMHLYTILEQPDIDFSDRTWISRKIRSIRDRMNNPSPRQLVVGSKWGRLSNQDSSIVNILTQIQNAKSILESNGRRQS